MRLEIPILPLFRHDEMKKVLIPNGEVTEAVLQEIASNTNRLIELGQHRPDHRETHGGSILSDEALGWSDRLTVKDGQLVSETDVTPKGAEKKTGKLLRWVSAGIRRDFDLGDGKKLPGLYLDHVAWLGRTRPKIKGLVDISALQPSAAFSSDTDDTGMGLVIDEETNAFALFSENRDAESQEAEMADPNVETRLSQLEAKFSEQANKLETVTAELSEERERVTSLTEDNERLKAENATLSEQTQKAERDAKFSEIAGKLNGAKVGKSVKEGILADAREAVDSGSEVAVKVIENTVARAVRNADKSLPGASAEFAEDEGEGDPAPVEMPSKAEFSEQASNAAASQKVNRAVTQVMARDGLKRDEAFAKVRAAAV
jgi:hypothetical protein